MNEYQLLIIQTLNDLKRREQEREEVLASGANWPCEQTINGEVWLTLWGAARRMAGEFGLQGDDALLSAWLRYLPELSEAIKAGNLAAISEGNRKRVHGIGRKADLMRPDDFLEWARFHYPTNFKATGESLPIPHEEAESSEPHKYQIWQEAVDAHYQKNNRLSHFAICKQIAKTHGTTPETMVRETKNPNPRTRKTKIANKNKRL